jgi:hypothetical protein
MRPSFLTRPGLWTRAARTAQSPADYACAVERRREAPSRFERMADVLLATAIGVVGALALVHWWSA